MSVQIAGSAFPSHDRSDLWSLPEPTGYLPPQKLLICLPNPSFPLNAGICYRCQNYLFFL